MSIRPITLNVITDRNEAGLRCPKTTSISFRYAKEVISEKTWGNLLARIWEAVSHVFCQQVYARVTNEQTGGFENKIFWVKGEVTTQPKITSSLDEPAPKPRNSSASSTTNSTSDFSSSLDDDNDKESSPLVLFPQLRLAEQELQAAILATRIPNWEHLSPQERNLLNKACEEAQTKVANLSTRYDQARDNKQAIEDTRRAQAAEDERRQKRLEKSKQKMAAAAQNLDNILASK